MTEKEEVYIALLTINLGGIFCNAYGMCRFLDRKFDIFNCVRVINNLINEELVEFVEKNGVKHFYINEKGNKALLENRDRIVEILKEKFPHEIEIINQL